MTKNIPFVVVAPAAVLALGTLVVAAMAWLGTHELDRQAEESAALHARVLSQTLLPRLIEGAPRDTPDVLERASRASGARLAFTRGGKLEGQSGTPALSSAELQALLAAPLGSDARLEDEIVHVAGSNGHRLAALVEVPESSLARGSLVTSLLTFATLLLAAGTFVAWALARDVHADILYLRSLIVNMAAEEKETAGHLIPVRTIDQVGQLTASFNTLLERFHAAERAYHQDLSGANAFDRDRSAFLSALSHELRTPLNAILGFTDVLLSEIDGPLSEESRENLTIVRQSGEHLRALIDDILALGALESGEFRLSLEQLDLFQVAQDVVTEARVTAGQKGLELELHRDDQGGSTVAQADRRRMRQVLGNVVSNAVKFTTKGRVRVLVARDGKDVILVVQDTGPGIAPDALERIFDEFEQSSAGAAQRTGTGLGLSITRRLVQLHGGSVRAESTLGAGSTFTIRIPVEPPQAPPSPTSLVRGQKEPLIREAESPAPLPRRLS